MVLWHLLQRSFLRAQIWRQSRGVIETLSPSLGINPGRCTSLHNPHQNENFQYNAGLHQCRDGREGWCDQGNKSVIVSDYETSVNGEPDFTMDDDRTDVSLPNCKVVRIAIARLKNNKAEELMDCRLKSWQGVCISFFAKYPMKTFPTKKQRNWLNSANPETAATLDR